MLRFGKHYSEQWEDEDIGLYDTPLPHTLASDSDPRDKQLRAASIITWDLAMLSDDDLLVEKRAHGSLTQHLVSAFLPVEISVVWKDVKAAEEEMEGRRVSQRTAAERQVMSRGGSQMTGQGYLRPR